MADREIRSTLSGIRILARRGYGLDDASMGEVLTNQPDSTLLYVLPNHWPLPCQTPWTWKRGIRDVADE